MSSSSALPRPLKPINLQLGWPSPSLIPRTALLTSSTTIFSSPVLTEQASIYGPDPGEESVREAVAKWLERKYYGSSSVKDAPKITADRILISNGASATLAQVLLKFTDPLYTRAVWMVEPTYFLACPTFEDAGFEGRLRGVPEDEEGIDLEFLRREIEKLDGETEGKANRKKRLKNEKNYPKLYRHVIYCVPTFSNPSAKTMSLRRRRELVLLARKFDALIVADDVYDFLRWAAHGSTTSTPFLGNPPPRLIDIDRQIDSPPSSYGNTLSNGTFSKLVAPGCRCSWVEASPDFIEALSTVGYTRSGGAGSQMSSVIIERLLSSGELDKHMEEVLIPTYRRRATAMINAIEKELVPLGVRVEVGKGWVVEDGKHDNSTQSLGDIELQGGFFTYLVFPSRYPPAEQISRIARSKYALKFAAVHLMVVKGDEGSLKRVDERGCRLSWSWHSERTIERGVKRLGKLLKSLDQERVDGSGQGQQAYEENDDDGEDSGIEAYFGSN